MAKKKIAKKKVEPVFLEFKGFLSFLILHEVSINSLTGKDLAKKIGARKGATLTAGTIYPALKKLRAKKLVKYKRFGRNKVYYLTEVGEKTLEEQYKIFSRYFYGLKKFIKRKNL